VLVGTAVSWRHIELHTRCPLSDKQGDLTGTVVQRGDPGCESLFLGGGAGMPGMFLQLRFIVNQSTFIRKKR